MKWCITNGDLAAERLRHTASDCKVLPWRDALHEGPVRTDLPFSEWSARRADFISAAGWAPEDEVRASLAEREQQFMEALEAREITLVFEHDLYDQLQLTEILYWLQRLQPHADLYLAQASNYLTELSDAELQRLVADRRRIEAPLIAEAARAFELFAGSDPRPLLAAAKAGFCALPYLAPAIMRHCAEFPSPRTGLGLTDERVLARLAEGECTFLELFHSIQAAEEYRYLGDTIFSWRLRILCETECPLIVSKGHAAADFRLRRFALTACGAQILSGTANALELCRVDRQLGGVRLSRERIFLFDRKRSEFLAEHSLSSQHEPTMFRAGG